MMKDISQIKPNYAPIYCALYPDLAKIFQLHGYALAVHGSLARDFDLIAVPWVNIYSKPGYVIQDISNQFAIKQVGEPEERPINRKVYTVSISHGTCFLDISFIEKEKPNQ